MDKVTEDQEFNVENVENISVLMVRKLFKDIFDKQQKYIIALISGNLQITNQKIDTLSKEIEKTKKNYQKLKNEKDELVEELNRSKERISKLESVKNDMEESITTTQDILENKVKDLERGMKKSNIEKSKLRQLEDRQRRNNLRIDGLDDNENESWDDTDATEMFEHCLGVTGVIIERAHRTGDKERRKKEGNYVRPRTIVLKLLNYKDKTRILRNVKKLKGTGIFINEDYSHETLLIRKQLFEEMKKQRENVTIFSAML